jgi:hypothetical protein
MRRITKCDLDKFYTKRELSIRLINKIDLTKYDLILDPSCGDGSFYSQINHENKIGIDIEPNIEGVIKSDFLEWDHSKISKYSKILVISNPPFGRQGSLAMKFIKKSAEFADTIAFILPISFSKCSILNKIPEYLHLQYSEILPDDSYLLDGKDYGVKCTFQIWEKREYKREKIKPIDPIGFEYVNKSECDISIRRVGVYAGKAFRDKNKSEQSHYFISINDKSKIDTVINELDKFNWVDLTVGPRSISKSELNSVINNIMN